jgi:hypothetical protein
LGGCAFCVNAQRVRERVQKLHGWLRPPELAGALLVFVGSSNHKVRNATDAKLTFCSSILSNDLRNTSPLCIISVFLWNAVVATSGIIALKHAVND